jgi:hypothetical protein
MGFGDAYINRLNLEIAERRAKRAAAASTTDPRELLKRRIEGWYRALPIDARAPSYFMEDLVRLLDARPQDLGLALRSAAWSSERRWVKGQSYRNHWIAPKSDQA